MPISGIPVQTIHVNDGDGVTRSDMEYESVGLTKREYFAVKAMQGMCANSNCEPTTERHYSNIVSDSVAIADALLKALEE